MASIERLVCMGLARGADPTRMGVIKGTGERFPTWEDCTGAVGLLDKLERGALGVKYAPHLITGDELASFTNHLWLTLIHFENKRGHRKGDVTARQAGVEAGVVRTALAESIASKTCRTCLRSRETGKVQQYVEGKGVVSIPCPRCNGAGWMPWSENKRAKSIGVHRDVMPKILPGYERVMKEASVQYQAAASRFMAVLFGTPDNKDQAA